MEGLSMITYRNKQIIYLDYSSFGNAKEQAIQLVKAGALEYMKYPLHSVIALVNVTNLRIDFEVMNTFKEEQDKGAPYEKKVAVFGLNTLHRIAYNFVVGSNKNVTVKAFDSEQEAKDWLVAD